MYPEAEHYLKLYLAKNQSLSVLYLLGVCQLMQGRLVEGMENYFYRWFSSGLYHSRWKVLRASVPYLTRWEDLKGKRIAVVFEQGFGDELMFSHVFKYIAPLCSRITYLPRAELVTFFRKYLPNTVEIVEKEFNVTAEYDYIVTPGDLFRLYCIEAKTLPELSVIDREATIHSCIGIATTTGKVGNAVAERQVPSTAFKVVVNEYGKDNVFQLLPEKDPLIDCNHTSTRSFLETAFYMRDLKAVITVDTAVAHLAQTIGVSTIILHCGYVDWRWKIGMYPNAKVIKADHNMLRNIREAIN
jgi:ABC-type amino acid transport substrate-binding protein